MQSIFVVLLKFFAPFFHAVPHAVIPLIGLPPQHLDATDRGRLHSLDGWVAILYIIKVIIVAIHKNSLSGYSFAPASFNQAAASA